jgi:excisionase family DNA binding protein
MHNNGTQKQEPPMGVKNTAAAGRQPMLLTLQQAAAETGVPYTSVRKLVLDGYLPRVQLGDSKRTWIKRTDLERLIANSTEPAA